MSSQSPIVVGVCFVHLVAAFPCAGEARPRPTPLIEEILGLQDVSDVSLSQDQFATLLKTIELFLRTSELEAAEDVAQFILTRADQNSLLSIRTRLWMVKMHIRSLQLDQAEQLLDEISSRLEGSTVNAETRLYIQALLLSGDLYRLKGNDSRALEVYQSIIQFQHRPPYLIEATVGKAHVLLGMGRAEEAEAMLTTLLASSRSRQPDQTRRLQHALAQAYTQAGRPEEAIALYHTLQHPDALPPPEVGIGLASAYTVSTQPTRAKNLLEDLLHREDLSARDRVRITHQLAGLYHHLGEFSRSLQLYDDLLSLSPLPPSFLIQLLADKTRVLLTLRHYEQAEKSLERLSTYPAATALYLSIRADLHRDQRDYARAAQLYERLTQEYPAQRRMANNNLFLVRNLKEFQRIKEMAQEQAQQSPNLPVATLSERAGQPPSSLTHNVWGNIHLQRGEYDRAIEEFQRAIAIAPDSLVAHTFLEDAYLRAGQPLRGMSEFLKTWELTAAYDHIYFPPAYEVLGRLYDYYRSTLDIQSPHATALFEHLRTILPRRYVSALYAAAGNIYLERGFDNEAEEYFQKAIAEQTSRHSHRDYGYAGMGMVRLHRGHIKEAMGYFNQALEVYPYSRYAHQYLGLIYDKHLHRSDKAASHYRKFLDLGGKRVEIEALVSKLQQEGFNHEEAATRAADGARDVSGRVPE